MNLPAAPPPLTEAQAAEAEAELRVALPPAYRRYLTEVSAGGAVSRLAKTERGWWWAGNDEGHRGLLSVPFPHPDSYAEADAGFDRREPRAEDHPDAAAFSRAMAVWNAERDEFEDRKTAGAVVAQEHGCGFATLLAITGPLAGTMWWDGRATCDLILPLSLDHTGGARPVTFAEWLGRSSWDLLPPGWG
ncbi:SMI1/KNR4 family protein [Streptomyces sp. NPDC056347]|uniref:SMI1/KNR4 family protein n=1 Tax=Streptomyces sp. NPDC056347 TaxID=3345790 RepID=UPI0035D6B7F1